MTMTPEWPPLITDAARPRWMLWRDRLLTMLVWLLFLATFIEQVLVFKARIDAYLASPDAEWDFLLRPFLTIAGLLVTWLVISGALTYRRAVRARRRPPPAPLALESEAARIGLAPADLRTARQHQIVAVTIEADGRLRIAAMKGGREPTYTESAAGRDRPRPPSPDRSVPGR